MNEYSLKQLEEKAAEVYRVIHPEASEEETQRCLKEWVGVCFKGSKEVL